MATFIVTNAADSGAGSLRDAIAQANATAGTDTITFDQAVFNGEAADRVRLTSGQITITESLIIDGGPNGVLITGDANGDDITYAGGVTDVGASLAGEDRLDDNRRVLNAMDATLLELHRLTITGGRTTGTLAIGGGVRAGFELRIIDSTIAGNSTTGYYARGGGVAGTIVELTNATLVGNTTSGDAAAGGGAFGAFIYAVNSTVTGNSTAGVGVPGIATGRGSSFGLAYTASADGGGLFGLNAVFLANSIVAGNATLGTGVKFEDVGFYRSSDSTKAGDLFAGQVAAASGPLVETADRATALVGFGEGALLRNGGLADDFSLAAGFSTEDYVMLTSVFADTAALSNGTIAGVLADNGGPVRTVALAANNANRALDLSAGGTTAADARGVAAVDIPGLGRFGAGPRDLGAFEVTTPEAVSLVVNTTSDVMDGFDGVTSLREAVAVANIRPGANTITFDPNIFDGSPGAIIRLTHGAIEYFTSSRGMLTIDGGPAGVTITGDRLGDDVTDDAGITDVMASIAGTNRLSDNSRIFIAPPLSPYAALTLKSMTLTGGYSSFLGYSGFTTNPMVGGGALTVAIATLIDTVVKGNATGPGFGGGGISGGDVTLLRSTVTDNHALDGAYKGGGIAALSLTLTDSVVSNNSVERGGGGGIYVKEQLSIQNGTITGNSSTGAGGGIHSDSDGTTITNSIILGNEATGIGVGGDNLGGAAATLTGNNIIGNDSGTGDIFHGATDVGDTTAAQVFADTLVLAGGTVAGIAADNGGPTETVALLFDPANPAIGGADPATATATDQRGTPRDAKPDLGAFEVANDTPVALADSAFTGRDMGIVFNITGNDEDITGGLDDTSIRLLGADPGSDGRAITTPGVGTWAIDPDFGFLVFTPVAGFQGVATAQYTVADIFGLVSAPTDITIDVAPGARGTATTGDDRLLGSLYGDSLDGLGGHDSIIGRDGADILRGGDGNDSIDAGRDGDDIDAGAGDDLILVRGLNARDDIILGGEGFDTVRVAPGAATVILTSMDWAGVEAFDGSGATVVGTVVDDRLDLSRFASVTGVAALRGGFGNDSLTGAGGGDSIAGSAGDDEITGGAGNDTMTGGLGEDRFVFGPGFGTDVILGFDANPAGGQDLLLLQGYASPPEVLFEVIGSDTRVTIGTDSVLLVGVTGLGARVASMADVVFVPDVVLE